MSLTFADVDYMKNHLENDVFDQKSIGILSEPEHLAKEMVSFGNNKFVSENFGGIIVIGINKDGDYENFEPKQGHEEFVMNVARDRIVPPMRPKFEVISSDDARNVYVITIPKMLNTPYGLKTEKGIVYKTRVGSTVRDISPDELAELHLVSTKNSAETEDNFKSKEEEKITTEFPDVSGNPSFRLTIIPIDVNQNMIIFNKENTRWLKSKIPKYTNIRAVELIQNEIHYDSKTRPSPDSELFVLNKNGSFAAIEFLTNYKERMGTNTLVIGRQIVLLASLFEYIKSIYEKFDYSGRLSIKLQLHNVQHYTFKDYDISDPFYYVSKKFLKSDVIIKRNVLVNSFNIRSLVESIFDEICKACDWVLEPKEIQNYFDFLKRKGYPIED